jgi:hypothetical protein
VPELLRGKLNLELETLDVGNEIPQSDFAQGNRTAAEMSGHRQFAFVQNDS